MSVEMFLFLNCMWFLAKCMICFYIIYGLSYIIPFEKILCIKKQTFENGDFEKVETNNSEL